MKLVGFSFALISLIFLVVGCDRAERMLTTKEQKVEITKQSYSKEKVTFDLPEDWEVSKDVMTDNGVRVIDVKDNHYSHVRVSLPPSGSYIDINDSLEAYKANFRNNLRAGKVSEFENSIAARPWQGKQVEGKRLRFAIDLAPDDFHIAELFLLERGKSNILVTISYPDKNFIAADPEIQVIFGSLRFE